MKRANRAVLLAGKPIRNTKFFERLRVIVKNDAVDAAKAELEQLGYSVSIEARYPKNYDF